MNKKVKKQLEDLFPEPDDRWDWRMARCTGCEVEDWREMNAILLRQAYLYIQMIIARQYDAFGLHAWLGIKDFENNFELPTHEHYRKLLLYNKATKEWKYLTNGLDKLADTAKLFTQTINEPLVLKIDKEGNPYVDTKWNDDDNDDE